jgi:2-polyprenyl-3-methyl-5-hydroxy-6-metoxy-1,4-benzoquinol methylase
MNKISEIDVEHYNKIRDNVSKFIYDASLEYDQKNIRLLDVAPEIHKGAKEHFKLAKVFTLDIDPNSNADFIADLCKNNSEIIPDNYFDIVICTEVLEHTNNPFLVVDELYRILKPNGKIYISTPFNFRIHGPLPDNWRFTIHGLNVLLGKFRNIVISELTDESRFLMPIQYTTIAVK